MISIGTSLIFDINKISLLDINELIDKGIRFKLKAELDEGEFYTDVKEYLEHEL